MIAGNDDELKSSDVYFDHKENYPDQFSHQMADLGWVEIRNVDPISSQISAPFAGRQAAFSRTKP